MKNKIKQKSDDVDYSYLAETIAREIYQDNTFDVKGMTLKIKMLLRLFITNTSKGLAIFRLKTENMSQKDDIKRLTFEAKFWKSKVIDNDKFLKQLNDQLIQKGLRYE